MSGPDRHIRYRRGGAAVIAGPPIAGADRWRGFWLADARADARVRQWRRAARIRRALLIGGEIAFALAGLAAFVAAHLFAAALIRGGW